MWNDAVLRELNPDISLPASQILRTFRSDVSGTTEMLTSALSSFSDTWAHLYGVSSRPAWRTGVQDGGGMLVPNAASVAGYVGLTPYSFGKSGAGVLTDSCVYLKVCTFAPLLSVKSLILIFQHSTNAVQISNLSFQATYHYQMQKLSSQATPL